MQKPRTALQKDVRDVELTRQDSSSEVASFILEVSRGLPCSLLEDYSGFKKEVIWSVNNPLQRESARIQLSVRLSNLTGKGAH